LVIIREDNNSQYLPEIMPQPSVRPIWLELQIDPNDPELLAILDRLVRSGMLKHDQIRQIAKSCLNEDLSWHKLPVVAVPVVSAVPVTPALPIPPNVPSPVQTIWQNLKDELSVRWLLFLGVFLVVLSSGVLAATQWSRFPAWGQYSLLWLYTIGFWVVGGWARRQEGLRLTASTLQIVTLLLIPVNFWAIDSFRLWQQPLELVTASVAGIGLAGIAYLQHRQRQGRTNSQQSGWLLVTYMVLSCLQLGWQIPYWPTISIYIGAIGVAIILQKIRQSEGSSLVVYGLFILLLRGLFVANLPIQTFGLAIGIVGWLFTQWGRQKYLRLVRLRSLNRPGESIRLARSQAILTKLAGLYQTLGAILLILGWLLSISHWLGSARISNSWQVLSVSCLALVWLWQHLRDHQQNRSVVALFVVGLQTYVIGNFLWERILPTDVIFAKILPTLILLFGQNYAVAGSLLIFPYLLGWVWLTDWFWRKEWSALSRTGELLILLTGALLTTINIGTPLSLLIDLLAATAILAHLTLRYLPVRSSYIYLTHLSGLATIFAALAYRWDWCRSIASNFVSVAGTSNTQMLNLTVLTVTFSLLAVGELWLSAQPVRRATDGWHRSSWRIGLGLAISAYACFLLLMMFPVAQTMWPICWLTVPAAFTYVATCKPPVQPWQLARQTHAAWWGIAGLGAGLLLTANRPEWRSMLLFIAVGLMFPLVKRLKQLAAAVIQIGFGLGLGISLVPEQMCANYWPLLGALTCAGLWLVSRKLPQIYASASDRWAIGLAGLGLVMESLIYVYHISIAQQDSLLSTVTAGTAWLDHNHGTTLLATGILAGSIGWRRHWRDSSIPKWVWFWGLNWTMQISLAALVYLCGGDTLALATANIVLAFPIWIWTNRQVEPESKILPGLLAGWGLLLRLPFFTNYTGLLLIAVGVIGVLTSRKLHNKSIGYGGMGLATLGCYELVTHYILQAPSGGNIADALTVYGLVTAVLALSYRLGVWWRSRTGADLSWDFPLPVLKKIAHIHWAIASMWIVTAAIIPPVPIPQLTLLHLFVSILLGGYALLQARHRHDGDWWVYLGWAELLVVGIYNRSIFQGWEIIDESLILIACVVGLLMILAPWQKWGWNDRPWRLVAMVLPLLRLVYELDRISLLNLGVLAVFYGGVAWRQRQFGWAYLSLIFVNWAGLRLLFQSQLTSPIWSATLIGLSILAAVQWDPYWQKSRQNRHYGRLLGSGIIAVTALVWHQPWLPIGIGLAISIGGLLLRVRGWLYIGTMTLLLTTSYQLLVLITEYPITKWAIGLLAGVLIITLAANFERRKSQIERVLKSWFDRLQEWQ
jgi:hypothetical protein